MPYTLSVPYADFSSAAIGSRPTETPESSCDGYSFGVSCSGAYVAGFEGS